MNWMDGQRGYFVVCTVGSSHHPSTIVEPSNKKIKLGQHFACVFVFARLLGLSLCEVNGVNG